VGSPCCCQSLLGCLRGGESIFSSPDLTLGTKSS
jgi:hypothetical protein